MNLEIAGMHCEHCVQSVRRALAGLSGLSECQVDVGRASLVIDETKCFKTEVFAAVRAAGAFDIAGFSTREQPPHGQRPQKPCPVADDDNPIAH